MMANYQPITEADLESPQPPPQGVVNGGDGVPTGYQPVNDNDLAPTGPVPGQTSEFAYKGVPAAAAARFQHSSPIANIFVAAASRFAKGFVNTFNDLNEADGRILADNGYGQYNGPGALLQHAADTFNSGATLLKNGFFATGAAISEGFAGTEGQIAREAGAPESMALSAEREGGFIGTALQSDVGSMHGAAMIDAAKAQAAAPGIWGHAYRLDDVPPDGPGGGGGGLTHTPLGRLPSADEAKGQAATVADALHLPPETATLIHQTYIATGRPPAEVLMDAQSNHGGVLDDLVAGKVPEAYIPTWPEPKGPASAIGNKPTGDKFSIQEMAPKEFYGPGVRYNPETDKVFIVHNPAGEQTASMEVTLDGQNIRIDSVHSLGGPNSLGPKAMLDVGRALRRQFPDAVGFTGERVSGGRFGGATVKEGQGVEMAAPLPSEPQTLAQSAAEAATAPEAAQPPVPTVASAPTPEQGVSKIGQSIEAKAVEDGLTEGFANTAGYDKITIKDQAARTASLINDDLDRARAVIRGDRPLPDGMKGTALITAMEDYIKKNPDPDMAHELANSPLVSATSEAAQEMRLAAERTPDSAAAKIQEIRDALQKKAGGPKEIAARRAAVKQALPEAGKVLLPKEELSWDRFLEAIKC